MKYFDLNTPDIRCSIPVEDDETLLEAISYAILSLDKLYYDIKDKEKIAAQAEKFLSEK